MKLVVPVRESRFLASVIGGGALLVLAGVIGAASSAAGQINGCENLATGVIRVLNNTNLSPPMNACLTAEVITSNHLSPALTEVPMSWNVQGPQGIPGTNGKDGINGTNGTNGVSVTSAGEPAGANCAYGGAAFTAANGTTYACNGAPGKDGINGTNGANGTNGTNGTNGISVTSAVEPAGANCPYGGSSFTSSSGETYACNGAPGAQGPGAATYWALVNADGSLLKSQGLAIICTPNSCGPGKYLVQAPQDITACAVEATETDNGTAQIDVAMPPHSVASNNDFRVQIWRGYDVFGTPSFGNDGFAVAVFC